MQSITITIQEVCEYSLWDNWNEDKTKYIRFLYHFFGSCYAYKTYRYYLSKNFRTEIFSPRQKIDECIFNRKELLPKSSFFLPPTKRRDMCGWIRPPRTQLHVSFPNSPRNHNRVIYSTKMFPPLKTLPAMPRPIRREMRRTPHKSSELNEAHKNVRTLPRPNKIHSDNI